MVFFLDWRMSSNLMGEWLGDEDRRRGGARVGKMKTIYGLFCCCCCCCLVNYFNILNLLLSV